jgi:hypothetical protein
MLNVTLTLTAHKWIKLRDAALEAFPNELLSRGEITRRFALAGVSALKDVSDADRALYNTSIRQR